MKRVFLLFLLLLYLQNAQGQNREYDSLKNLINVAKDDSSRFTATADLIWAYIYSNPDSAAKYIQQNIFLATKLKSAPRRALAYGQYGSLEQVNGNYPLALHYMLQSLRASEQSRDYFWISLINSGISDIYKDAGDFDNAVDYARKAISILESQRSQVTENDSLWGTGFRQTQLILAQIFERFDHRLDSALQFAENAYDSYIKVNRRMDWTPVLYTLGNIYSKIGNYSMALANYREGLAIADSLSIVKDKMDCYSGMAVTFKKMGQLDSGIYYANRVLDVSKMARNIAVRLDALNLLADIYKSKQNSDSVSKYLELSIATKDSLFNQQKVMEVQSISFNEELRLREIQDEQEQYQNRLRTSLLIGGLLAVLLVAGILYRNNLQKQKAKIKIEKAYEELKATQTQLVQSEKMASLGELTAGIAHEIQNPLNFVNNFSEVNKELSDELEQEAAKGNMDEIKIIAKDIKANSEKINLHGKRADSIVKSMLQHSRTSSGVKEPTDINGLADEYLRLSYHGFRSKDKEFNATMKFDFDPGIGKISIIPQDIGRVLLNLYNNAFYSVNEKKKRIGNGYDPVVTVSTKKTGNKIEIEIADNGEGISREIVDKIFHPFFTTKPTGQGTGLGLSLSYDIVKAHGGEIRVVSSGKLPAKDDFTKFVVVLPV